ncbi:BTB domain-containing protein [Favolaschia claudopus]|uniref:BTB domain-containing protein n=1 Tax=Favolaschia claudopus TaxID=2862362 RepID=A0AAV9Z2H1_9AGAR
MDVDSQAPDPALFLEDLTRTGGLTRADGLWFEDCGLIILAEKTIFRVSRDYLAAHSPIFKDMLALPAPRDRDMMFGLPFVSLFDSADDVTVFLKALMFPDFFEPHPAPTSLAVLTAVLRMSHKYDVESLRKRALIHLSSQFPTQLHDYDSLASEKDPLWIAELKDVDGPGFHSLTALARSLSIVWILPIAFYRVCAFSSEEDILTVDHTLNDKVNIVIACRTLEGAAVTNMLDFLWPSPVGGCSTPSECSASKFAMRRHMESIRNRPFSRAPTMPLNLWRMSDWEGLPVCTACLESMKAKHEEAKQEHWDSIPEMFELPSWTELEKLKAEALN